MYSNDLLKVLTPFDNQKKVLVYNQGVGDIINALIDAHYKNRNQYDLIYSYFVGDNPEETANNVFNYLKKNVKYVIESDDNQLIKSPAAIIATGKSGSDCKNYALFSAGILDAYRRNEGLDFDLYFRFASYEYNDKTPQHVFCVISDGNEEIWIDPVLDFFNQKKMPYFYKDKKIKNMLSSLSGILGDIGLPSAPTYINPNTAPAITQNQIIQPSGFNNIVNQLSSSNTTSTVNSAVNVVADVASGNWVAAAQQAFNTFQSLWGGQSDVDQWRNSLSTKTPNVRAITYLDYITTLPAYTGGNGDSQEARFNQYRELFGNDLTNGTVSQDIANAWNAQWAIMMQSSPHKTDPNLINSQFTAWAPNNSNWITNGVINKDGVTAAAQTGRLLPAVVTRQYNAAPAASGGLFNSLFSSSTNPATGSATQTAGISTIVVLGLIGAGLYMFTKKSK
jgi:hypothetical protein